MAKVVLIGEVAHVEILADPEDEELVLARCSLHPAVRFCTWRRQFSSFEAAIKTVYAEDHADTGRR